MGTVWGPTEKWKSPTIGTVHHVVDNRIVAVRCRERLSFSEAAAAISDGSGHAACDSIHGSASQVMSLPTSKPPLHVQLAGDEHERPY
jgi:hypothetical protein